MTQITISVKDGEVKQAFIRAGLAVERLPTKVIRAEMEAARDLARTYPAELPNQKYVRTGKRYAATKVEKVNNYTYRVVSNPRYKYGNTGNPYVLGDADGLGQARIHAGRWNLLRDVMFLAFGRIVQKGEEYFRAVLERNGAP